MTLTLAISAAAIEWSEASANKSEQTSICPGKDFMDEMLSAIHRGKQAFKHLKNSLNRQGNDHLQPGRHLDTRERGMKGFLLANPRPARLEDPPKKSLDNDFCAPSQMSHVINSMLNKFMRANIPSVKYGALYRARGLFGNCFSFI